MKKINEYKEIIVKCCMNDCESMLMEYHKELTEAVRQFVYGECTEREYITMAAKATAKLATFVARDTAVNCRTIDTMR